MAETINSHLKHGLLQVHTDCTSGHQSPAVVTGGRTCVIAFLYFFPCVCVRVGGFDWVPPCDLSLTS